MLKQNILYQGVLFILMQPKIMMEMEKIFFSSTFGGETLSLAAGFATLKKLQSHAITDHLWKIGAYLTNQLNTLICDKIVDAIFKLPDNTAADARTKL